MPDRVQSHLALLGHRAQDRVTGLTGVVTSVSFDLYGCIQCILHPGLDKEGKPRDQVWFDINRLEVGVAPPVMPQPDFVVGPIAEGKHGAAEKPPQMRSA